MEEYIVVNSSDESLVGEIYSILFRCGINMARKFLFHWLRPYSKSSIKNDCDTKQVVLVRDNATGRFTSTFQMYIDKEGNLYVRKIATLPEFEGRGIGKRNMQYMEAYARAQGCPKVCLDVYKKSSHAIGFYKKNGFAVVGERKARFFSEYIMEKAV